MIFKPFLGLSGSAIQETRVLNQKSEDWIPVVELLQILFVSQSPLSAKLRKKLSLLPQRSIRENKIFVSVFYNLQDIIQTVQKPHFYDFRLEGFSKQDTKGTNHKGKSSYYIKSCRTSCDKISYTILRQEVAWEQILAKELLSRVFKTTDK